MELRLIITRVDQLRAEIDALRPIDAEQEARVMQMFRLDWNYHSNAIEGNTLTLGELADFVEMVGEALIGSLERYLRAARHQSLEEPGEFEHRVLRLHEQLASYET